MKKDRIRTEQENQRHRALIEENRRERLRKLQIQQNEKLVKYSFKTYSTHANPHHTNKFLFNY